MSIISNFTKLAGVAARCKNLAQPKRTQAYYDAIANQLKKGMLSYNSRTGNTIYSTNSGTAVLKGNWNDTRLNFAKHDVMNKFNPNPSVLQIVGKDNIIKYVSNTSTNNFNLNF